MKKILSILFVLMPLASSASYLCSQVHQMDYLFGLEFTLTNQTIVDEGNRNPKDYSLESNPIKNKHWQSLLAKIKEKCAVTKDCTTEMTRDKHGPALKVIFEDGFYFTVGSDSATLEANAKPQTPSGYRNVLSRMEEYLFAIGRDVGLKPHERAGGGHIHISRKAFEENSMSFRNFLVDFQNRPELIYGAFGNHLGNGAPLAALKPAQRDAFEKVLKEFNPAEDSIDTLVNRLHSQVFTQGYIEDWGAGHYYQAFNMTRMQKNADQATLEIRSFRPQENTEVFQLQVYLLEAWVNKVKAIGTALPYVRKDRHNFTPQEVVDSYSQLLESLNLPWEKFAVLLPPQMRSLKPKKNYQSVPYDLSGSGSDRK